VIDIEDIDLAALDQVSFETVWAEAMELYMLLGQNSFRLTPAERDTLRKANKQYQLVGDEEKLLLEKLDWEQPREQWKEFTATALCELMGTNRGLSAVKVGRALKRIGYDKDSEEYPMRIKDGIATYSTPSKTKYVTDFQ
jgi:predicted P-loop ATPase